jgi:hypothetical protein
LRLTNFRKFEQAESNHELFSHYTIEFLIATVSGLIVLYLWYLWDKFCNRVKIKLATKKTQREVSGMLELYSHLFPEDGTNYSSEEILNFLADKNGKRQATHVQVEDFFLVATVRNDVVGFLFCHYYPEIKYAIVSYFGIDKNSQQACKFAAELLLKKLMTFLRHQKQPCELLVFELQKPDENLEKAQNQEREARVRRFRQRAASFDLHAYQILIEYQRPKLSLDPNLKEENLVLMCVPLTVCKATNTLSKPGVIKLLEFIHHYCYADFYSPSDPSFIVFKKYLNDRMELYQRTLPDPVPVK